MSFLVCYGFNETWDYGEDEGITRFEANLARVFSGGMQSRNYNGESTPKIVLYSPIACEGTTVPDTPKRNHLLSLYTNAMQRVADSLEIPCVDLYSASRAIYRKDEETKAHDQWHPPHSRRLLEIGLYYSLG
jgi:hypothetical protein